MAITGRTLGEAARRFTEHLNQLLAKTITETRLVCWVIQPGLAMISFRQAGQVTEAPLKTDYGPLRLSLGQICAPSPTDGGGHRLYTLKYAYYIYLAEAEKRPILRWEYTRKWPTGDSRWCRHHLQGPVNLPIGESPTSLDALHLPTGYMCVEDIIRFCICDLGARSKSENWHELLEESYRSFTTDFTQSSLSKPDSQS